MEMNLLILFIVLNIVNVVLQTVKSIATIKCGKVMAGIINAIAYGLYTVVLVYTMCELPLMWKAAIVALCNFVGVFVVKWIEEKARKDKLWKVEATVYHYLTHDLHTTLTEQGIAHNYIEGVGQYSIFNIYCPTQHESLLVRELLEASESKYFVSESKTL